MPEAAKTYEWKNADVLTLAAQAATGIYLVLLAISTFFSYWRGDSADEGASGLMLSLAGHTLVLLSALAAAVLSALWLIRVSTNAHVLQPTMKHSPLGAVGWYFVPIAWWFKPYAAFSEIWRVSSTKSSRSADRLLAPWWGTWVLSPLLTFGGMLEPASLGDAFDLAATLCGAVATVLFVILIGRLNQAQRETRQQWIAAGRPLQAGGALDGVTEGA